MPAVVTCSFAQAFLWVSSLPSLPHYVSLDYLPDKLPSPRSSAQGWLLVEVKARHSVFNRPSQSLKSRSCFKERQLPRARAVHADGEEGARGRDCPKLNSIPACDGSISEAKSESYLWTAQSRFWSGEGYSL